MNDNRNNSADNRYQGFVSEANLVGQATAIWMNFDKWESEWSTSVRLSRIGGIHQQLIFVHVIAVMATT